MLKVLIFGRVHTITEVHAYYSKSMIVTLDNGMEAMVPKSQAMIVK
jgi:hypothetical protein